MRQKLSNVYKYQIFHYLLSLMKVSQDTGEKCYSRIPLVPFDRPYSDKYLFDFFHLDASEIKYITDLVWSNNKK